MNLCVRTRARARISSGTTAIAMAAALVAAPILSPPALATTAATTTSGAIPHTSTPGVRTVTLVTGDRVILRTDADGKVTASLTPGSPHYGRQVEFVTTGARTWVVPKLAPALRSKLDNSVFDASALAGRRGRVPLTVTFAPGASPRNLPGIRVRTSTAQRSAGGRTTVTASYDARRALPGSLRSSLSGVSKIALRGVSGVTMAAGYDLHTLTINATTPNGAPLRFGDLFILNMDDARLFGGFGAIIHGQWKVSVPAGHYLIITSDFRRLVVDQPVVGDTDTTTSFSMAAATVKPQLSYPGHESLEPNADLIGRDAAHHGGIDYGFSGGVPKLSPVSTVAAGSLVTEVGELWSAKGYQPYDFQQGQVIINPIKSLSAAREVRTGIPNDLTFTYRDSDFATVALKHYATGPKTRSLDGWFGWSKNDFGAFISLYPSIRPGVIHASFEGSPDISWDSLSFTGAGFRSFGSLEAQHVYHRGQHAQVSFFRGPVTPVADRGDESGASGRACAFCVTDGDLHGFLAMIAGAGTTQRGFADNSSWQLYQGRDRIDQGQVALVPFVRGVTPGQKLTLFAQTGPQSTKWTLSSKVSDRWDFSVPDANAVIPILRASYVPPTDLKSRGRAGRVAFPITFDNLGPVDARVATASVKYSVDGKKWRKATLTRKDGNTFRVSYTNPSATAAHTTMSLRVSATDAAGRAVQEQVANAYLLPHAKAGGGQVTTATTSARRFDGAKLCRTAGVSRVSCYVKLDAATRNAGRASPDPAGWGAPALRDAYGLTGGGADTTVGVVVAYDYPNAEADLNHYRKQFGLPACTSASGCFTKVNQLGEQGPYPQQDYGWGVEASLDLQMISAACPTCHIVLAEAKQPVDHALGKATRAAIANGATVTNHSYGRIETTGVESAAAPYSQPGVTAVSSTGDFGYGPASFPASTPDVVAVGGTRLARSTTDPRGWSEKVWQYAGSGCSAYFAKPGYQTDTSCHMRSFADVSAIASGLAIYNTSLPKRYRGWLRVSGTSASSPFVAGMIGAAGSGGLKPDALYGHDADFNDVVTGRNGFCQDNYICTAGPGYDGPTGIGTPQGVSSFLLP